MHGMSRRWDARSKARASLEFRQIVCQHLVTTQSDNCGFVPELLLVTVNVPSPCVVSFLSPLSSNAAALSSASSYVLAAIDLRQMHLCSIVVSFPN